MTVNTATAASTFENEISLGLIKYFNHLWGFIQGENIGFDRKKKVKWSTNKKFKLNKLNLLQRFLDEKNLLGIRFDTNKNAVVDYLMTDIDIGSKYHPLNNLKRFIALLYAFEEAGLPGRATIESSPSGGLHVYFSLSKALPVFDAACFLKKIVENAGFQERDGQLELFPNCKGWSPKGIVNYKAHRLPLQPKSGSYLLDDDLNVVSDDFRAFIRQMDWNAKHKNIVDDEMLANVQAAKEAVYMERCSRGSTGMSIVIKWQEDLELYHRVGWTSRGETNEILCKFATYGVVFLGLTGDELTQYIVETARNTPGYEEFCGHKHEIEQRAAERARAAERYYWKLGDLPKRLGTYQEFEQTNSVKDYLNQSSTEAAKNRVREATRYLWEESPELLPSTIREYRALLLKTLKQLFGLGSSLSTLSRQEFKNIWHPAFIGRELPTKGMSAAVHEEDIQAANEASEVAESAQEEPILSDESNSQNPVSELTEKSPNSPQNKDVYRRKNPLKLESLKRPSDKDVYTPPIMKVLNSSDSDISLNSPVAASFSDSSLKKNNSLQPLQSEQLIRDSYTPPLRRDPQNGDKQNLSVEAQRAQEAYYKNLIEHHPDLKALEDAKTSPEYQTTSKQSFERIRHILGRNRRKSSRESDPSKNP